MPSRGGDRPTLYVTVSEEGLLARDAQARLLDDQTRLDAPETRRIACDARLARLVFSAEGAIVDLGQSRRLFTGPLRRALAARDRGCAFPGCDMPAVACEGHHIVPWQEGGATSLENVALLCPRHHRMVEPDPGSPASLQWQVRLDAETRLRLRSIDTQLLRILEDLAAGRQDLVTEIRQDIAGLAEALRLLARRQ